MTLIRRFNSGVKNISEVVVHRNPQDPPKPTWIQTGLKIAKYAMIALAAGAAAYVSYQYLTAPSSSPIIDQLAHIAEDPNVPRSCSFDASSSSPIIDPPLANTGEDPNIPRACPFAAQSPWRMIHAMGTQITTSKVYPSDHQYTHVAQQCASSEWVDFTGGWFASLKKQLNDWTFSFVGGKYSRFSTSVVCHERNQSLVCSGRIQAEDSIASYSARESMGWIVEKVCDAYQCVNRHGTTPAYLMELLQKFKTKLAAPMYGN